MRKDVRLGFAVGGVLLAVIVVAVLVFHRNHGKQVVFDAGKQQTSGGTADPGTIDVGSAPSTESQAKPSEPAVSNPSDATPPPAVQPKQDEPAAQPQAQPLVASKGPDKWDTLFATTEEPVKAQMTSSEDRVRRRSPEPTIQADPPLESANSGAQSNTQRDIGGSTTDVPAPVRSTREMASVSSDMTANHGRVHRVEAGETMVSIARAAYGDGRYYLAVENANPSVNPNRLKPGTVLHLPPASEVKQSSRKRSADQTSGSRSSARNDADTYVVKSGDNLYLIAHKLGRKQDELYALNRQTIGPDSTKLKIGMVLKLPSRGLNQ